MGSTKERATCLSYLLGKTPLRRGHFKIDYRGSPKKEITKNAGAQKS